MKKPFIYRIQEKENLFFLIAALIFFSSGTQLVNNINIAVDHFLVGLIFLIGAFGIRSFKDKNKQMDRLIPKGYSAYGEDVERNEKEADIYISLASGKVTTKKPVLKTPKKPKERSKK